MVELPAHLVVGRHLALAERGRHVAVGEDDVGEGLGELPVGPAEVGAREVVQAARVDEDCGRKLRETLEDVRDALDDRVLKLAVAQVLLGHGDRGEAALQAEFGCAEYDAPEAALGADEDLVAFGHEHAHVHDGPGAARGRRVFEALPEGHGPVRLGELRRGCGKHGPVILMLSSAVAHKPKWTFPMQLRINLKPALTADALDARVQRDFQKYLRKQVDNALKELLPQHLIPVVLDQAGIAKETPVNQITRIQRQDLVTVLQALSLTLTGTRPIAEAIVTAGGVSVREINPKTMESKCVEGLYFAGEVMDIDAFTGGYNLQAAFSTGVVAGRAAAAEAKEE